jgi:hypothetical protein
LKPMQKRGLHFFYKPQHALRTDAHVIKVQDGCKCSFVLQILVCPQQRVSSEILTVFLVSFT